MFEILARLNSECKKPPRPLDCLEAGIILERSRRFLVLTWFFDSGRLLLNFVPSLDHVNFKRLEGPGTETLRYSDHAGDFRFLNRGGKGGHCSSG